MEMLLLHNQCDSSISCTAVFLLVQWCQNKPANDLVTDFEFSETDCLDPTLLRGSEHVYCLICAIHHRRLASFC